MLKSLSPQSEWLRAESLKSESPNTGEMLRTGHACMSALCLLAVFLTLPLLASAQSFTLQAPSLSEDAVGPGGTSSANITVGTVNGFSGSVDLTCQVTPAQPQTIVDNPVCTVSPATVTPPATASATITTKFDTTQVSYDVTVTGTAASNAQTTTTPPLYMTVIDVTPQFTITVEKPTQPASVPAGNSAVAVISINPINGYTSGTAGVTLSCSSITPLVTIPPVCSFNPNPVPEGVVTSQLSISTYGPTITRNVVRPRSFYALWLPFPMLALAGLGAAASGKRARKAWGLLALFVLTGTLFLMPACGNTTTQRSAPNGVTPNNNYSFTISGVDGNGNVSSNAGSGSTNPTVSLTVTTATTN